MAIIPHPFMDVETGPGKVSNVETAADDAPIYHLGIYLIRAYSLIYIHPYLQLSLPT